MSQDLEATPLSDAELPPAVLRTVGPQAPAPMKLLAARGMAPLPPQDLSIALFQLSVTGDEIQRRTAQESIAKLPEAVLKVALPAALPARVLEFFARRLFQQRVAVELLLRNRAADDRTIAHLASVCATEELDLIAGDEQRLLRHPPIIAALYMNVKTRASTALRAVELAARNGLKVDIPGYDEVVASLTGVTITAKDDEVFQAVVPAEGQRAAGDDLPLEAIEKLGQEDIEKTQAEEEAKTAGDMPVEDQKRRFGDLPVPLQIRAATLGNAFDRSMAIRSTVRLVAMAAIKSPGVSANEAVKYSSNRALHEEVIRYISNKKEWTQLNSIRLALINNNKCPLGTSMRFLSYIHSRDLKAVSRSRNVPGPLVKAAKELLGKRERRSG